MRLFWLSLLLILGAGAEPLRAHEAMSGWRYDPWCCTPELDCAEIPTEAVRITRDGYLVTLRPGDHKMLAREPEPRSYLIRFRDARVSPDGRYHACIYPTPETMRCFFAPPQGF